MTIFKWHTILKQRNLILRVTFSMDDVVMKLVSQWSLVKTEIISRPTDHQWSLLVIKELWSRQVEGLKFFKEIYCPPQ